MTLLIWSRWVSLVAQELLTLPEHLSFSGIRVTRSLVLCVFFGSLFVLFLLAIVLSVLLRYTDSGCPLVSSSSSYNHTRVRNVKYVTYVFWVFFSSFYALWAVLPVLSILEYPFFFSNDYIHDRVFTHSIPFHMLSCG